MSCLTYHKHLCVSINFYYRAQFIFSLSFTDDEERSMPQSGIETSYSNVNKVAAHLQVQTSTPNILVSFHSMIIVLSQTGENNILSF